MRHLLTTLVAVLLLAGCGQTGPLYLPQEEPPAPVPEQAPVEEPQGDA